MSDKAYLIWSHEHAAWWGPAKSGYTTRLSDAGHYTHTEALHICAKAIPGTAQRLGVLPELPVALSDVHTLRDAYRRQFPDLPQEWWE